MNPHTKKVVKLLVSCNLTTSVGMRHLERIALEEIINQLTKEE